MFLLKKCFMSRCKSTTLKLLTKPCKQTHDPFSQPTSLFMDCSDSRSDKKITLLVSKDLKKSFRYNTYMSF